MGGQSGAVGHVTIGDDCKIGAASPVIGSLPPGADVWGFPARARAKALREMAALSRVRDMQKELRELRRRMDAISQAREADRQRGGDDRE